MQHQPILPGEYREEDRGYKMPCWIWQRGCDGMGYGALWYRGRVQCAHRVYYTILVAPPAGGLDLDHLCRVPRCVNPDHLEPVTHAENIRRRRDLKLSKEKAAEIRRVYAMGGVSTSDLGVQFGVSAESIRLVVHGKLWSVDK